MKLKDYTVIAIYSDEMSGETFQAPTEKIAIELAAKLVDRPDVVGFLTIPGKVNLDEAGFWKARVLH